MCRQKKKQKGPEKTSSIIMLRRGIINQSNKASLDATKRMRRANRKKLLAVGNYTTQREKCAYSDIGVSLQRKKNLKHG